MFFQMTLTGALIVFGIGLLYKVSTWFRFDVGPSEKRASPAKRLGAFIKGLVEVLFSSKILVLLRVFFLDVLLQMRTFKESRFRWAMHMTLFWGFILLLLMHALERQITASLFPDYAATLNPFLFLRNLLALVVLTGMGMAVYRRWVKKPIRLMTGTRDRVAIVLLAVIFVSGILLEATKIFSQRSYQSMVEEYADADDEESLQALESFWVEEFGLFSPHLERPFDEETLAAGQELHEMSCASCHSKPQWAFLSYGVSRIARPGAAFLDRVNATGILWVVHFLACFAGLAYLPFSKMFHALSSPLSLMANAVMDKDRSHPANIATRQVMELDACTHCGACTAACSVGIVFEAVPNVNILPSEKIGSLKALAAGKKLQPEQIRTIQAGLYLCTNCTRCTVACPVGINLQDLWFQAREAFLEKGYPELMVLSPLSIHRALSHVNGRGPYTRPLDTVRQALGGRFKSLDSYGPPIDVGSLGAEFKKRLRASSQSQTFTYCFTCTTCTSACPVVRNYENPREKLGLVPHQIIRSAVLGLAEPIYRSSMLWNCLGCYQCQEHCPQGVRVADILYELKNEAAKQFNAGQRAREGEEEA